MAELAWFTFLLGCISGGTVGFLIGWVRWGVRW